ncbi:serine hydrolase [Brachybacterium sacelli]|uniref:Beta-lactamase class A n=1 Tax=Brachybacterium sacelli TaxID=173364 RepID=A0ABS4WYJ2_9MICO|nr:serine hydrolase [Brachybacterium sacelli]MBP2381213.1 beta-lactamase class A [Brachybacterium sacelli]
MTIPTAAAPTETAVSFCLLDAEGRQLAAEDAERPYYAASTIKLHVLLAALQAAERGALDLDSTVAATRSFTGADGAPFTLGGDHLDPTYPLDGERVSIQALLTRMIDRSSNEATNHLLELVGLDAVAESIAGLGLRATRLERLIGDASALAAGATNETSAIDLARTMRALVHGDGGGAGAGEGDAGLSRSSTVHSRAALSAQQIPVIGRSLREGVAWGSKSGWVDGYRHDAAFVGDPGSPDVCFLAVMTAGLDPEVADERIAALTRELLPDRTR